MACISDQSNVDRICNAVLYEGYILYPYRADAVKNQNRWTFGGVFPQSYEGVAGESDQSSVQSQCLVTTRDVNATVTVRLRCLQLVRREVVKAINSQDADVVAYQLTDSLEVDGQDYQAWDEAIEQERVVAHLAIDDLARKPAVQPFGFSGVCTRESLFFASGLPAGAIVRKKQAISGQINISAKLLSSGVYQLTVSVTNLTSPNLEINTPSSRSHALPYCLHSAHLLLEARNGEFISMIDPPSDLADSAQSCRQEGLWPVLIGDEPDRSQMLAAPIILYDYPQVAEQSVGDFFDGTEIDEMLTLRIRTLTDAEKKSMRSIDSRTAAMLDRTELLSDERLGSLHGRFQNSRLNDNVLGAGALKSAFDEKPEQLIMVDGVTLRPGDRVRLHPNSRSDIFDIALAGKVATIASIERDYEDQVYATVTVDDDPGQDLGVMQKPGHRFFFKPDEMEPVEQKIASS